MDPERWKTLAQYAQYILMILVAGAAWAAHHFGVKVERAKKARQQATDAQHAQEMDTLLRSTGEIRELLSTRYPGVPAARAVKLLEKELTEQLQATEQRVTQVARRHDFRALDAGIRDRVVNPLRHAQLADVSVLVGIEATDQNRDRQLLVNQLVDVLLVAGIRARPHGFSLSLGASLGPPATFIFDPKDTRAVDRLEAALQPLLGVTLRRISASGQAGIQITLHGVPEFAEDGTVILR